MMETITIGRKPDNNIVVPSSYSTVSGNHATVFVNNGEYVLEDHSSNGSYVNGTKLHYGKMAISPNDVILLSSQYRLDNNMIFHDSAGTRLEYSPSKGRSTERFSRKDYPNVEQPSVYGPPTPNIPRSSEPSNIHSFNFGAFMFGWLWGICNGVYIALLTLIPAINLIMCIILGVKGNEWAWEKQKSTATPDNFVETQKRWSKAGVIVLAITLVLCFFYFVLFLAIM